MAKREWSLHVKLGLIDVAAVLQRGTIVGAADRLPSGRYDVVIHVGASRSVKQWPIRYYDRLIRILNSDLRIAFVGLPAELQPLQPMAKAAKNVTLESGSIADVVSIMATGGIVVTMDSGFSHVASLLGVPHLAIFGSTDPASFAPDSQSTTVLYKRHLACQPCHQHSCKLTEIKCMALVTPEEVAGLIEKTLTMPAAHAGANG